VNQWEEHFQRYVTGRHFPLRCERIPEGKAKRPDFEISADKLPHKIVVEVKTLSPNDQDKRLRKSAEEYAEQVRRDPSTEPHVEVYIRSTHISVRNHLGAATKQFKEYSPTTASNLVVLYSERESDFRMVNPHMVEEAPFGDYLFHYDIAPSAKAAPVGTSRRNKFFQQTGNTIVSAVACLQEPRTNKFFVFHNPYAENRMPLFLFADGECVQYVPERIKGQCSVQVPYKIRL
jgi:hypothetical protein